MRDVGARRGIGPNVAWWAAALLAVRRRMAPRAFWRVSAPARRRARCAWTSPHLRRRDPVSIALSPDGESLAFVASSSGRPMLWVRSLATGEASPLPTPMVRRSRSGLPTAVRRSIGFFARTIASIASASMAVRCESWPRRPSGGRRWSPRRRVILFTLVPDGRSHAFAKRTRVAQPATSGAGASFGREPGRTPLSAVPARRSPLSLLHGRSRDSRRVRGNGGCVPNDDNCSTPMPLRSSCRQTGIAFLRAGTLFLQRFDSSTFTLDGEAVAIAHGVVVDATGAMAASASAAGSIVVPDARSANRQRQLAWFESLGCHADRRCVSS